MPLNKLTGKNKDIEIEAYKKNGFKFALELHENEKRINRDKIVVEFVSIGETEQFSWSDLYLMSYLSENRIRGMNLLNYLEKYQTCSENNVIILVLSYISVLTTHKRLFETDKLDLVVEKNNSGINLIAESKVEQYRFFIFNEAREILDFYDFRELNVEKYGDKKKYTLPIEGLSDAYALILYKADSMSIKINQHIYYLEKND